MGDHSFSGADPAGLLARVPELRLLVDKSKALAKAIEPGRPHAAYRALWWMRFGRAGQEHRELIDSLLQHRRLFLTGLTSAPVMFTLNLVGTRAYGQEDLDRSDGTYVMTLFFVVLLIPIFPFGSYLVSDSADPSKRGRAWSFHAKVPL